jgi:preprotein translocase subunit SecG
MNPVSKMSGALEPILNYGLPLILIIGLTSVYINSKQEKSKNKTPSTMMFWIVGIFFAAYLILNNAQNKIELETKCRNEINELISQKKKSKKDWKVYKKECSSKSFYTFYTLTYAIFGFTTNNSSYYYYKFQ